MNNYALVGTGVIVRYVDSDGKIKSETFSGNFSKTVTIPITSTGVDAALQVLIVPNTRDEVIAVGGDLDVTTDMRLSYVVNYDDKTQSNEAEISTENGLCATCKIIHTDGSTYDSYVPIFGGFVPAMARVGYIVDGDSYNVTTFPSFWKDNAYAPK